MTNQEAIERLQMILINDMILYMMNEKDEEAVNYAIEALEKIDKIENLKEPLCEDYSIKVRKILRGDV